MASKVVPIPEPTFPPGTWARFWTHIFRGIRLEDDKKTSNKPEPDQG